MSNNIIKNPHSFINPKIEDRERAKMEFVIKSLDAIIWEYDLEKDLLYSDSPASVLNGGKNFEEYIAIHHTDDWAVLRKAFVDLTSGSIISEQNRLTQVITNLM